jgi:hypothetical protein
MMTRTRAIFVAAGLFMASTVPVSAQQSTSVAELLPSLSADAAVITAGASGDHRNHFAPDLSTLSALFELNRVVALQTGGFPFGPSSLAASTLSSDGRSLPVAGGNAADSAFTVGGGGMTLAVGYQATTFDTLDGLDLRASEINLFLPHAPATGTVADRDILQQVVSLRLNRKVVSVALTYGMGDRTDVGVIVPIVQVAADARVTSRILRTGSSRGPAEHQFDPIGGANRTRPRYCSDFEAGSDQDALQCHGSSTARGIGDVLLRARYRFGGTSAGMSVGADVRLPTGSADNFIGLGALQVRPNVTFSALSGRFVPRVRVDYTWSEGELSSDLGGDIDRDVPDEIGVAAGLDAAVNRRVSLVFDVAARRIEGLREFTTGTIVIPGRGTDGSNFSGQDALLAGGLRTVMQIMGGAGVRLTLPGNLLGQMSVLVPVGDGGLQPGPMAVFSLTRSY